MLAAIKDKHVVVPVHADAADCLELPAGREFCPVLHWFVCVCAAANGSHARAPLFVAGRKLVTKQKVGPAQGRQRHLAAARTSNVFSTLCGWRHIFKTSETLFQSVRDSIQFTDWDPFARPERARLGKEDQREDRDEQAEQTLDASRVHD